MGLDRNENLKEIDLAEEDDARRIYEWQAFFALILNKGLKPLVKNKIQRFQALINPKS